MNSSKATGSLNEAQLMWYRRLPDVDLDLDSLLLCVAPTVRKKKKDLIRVSCIRGPVWTVLEAKRSWKEQEEATVKACKHLQL